MSVWGAVAQVATDVIRGDKERSQANRGYRRAREKYAPFYDAGVNALRDWQAGIGNFEFEEDPGYQFARDESLNAVTRQMNAMGKGRSGNILAELGRRAEGLASQRYNEAFNRYNTNLNHLASIAGMGLQAGAGTAAAAQGNAGMLMGNTRFGAQSINNAIQGGYSNYLLDRELNRGYRGYRGPSERGYSHHF